MTTKRYPLPKRFSVALSDKAYKKLRELNKQYQYGNNYLLTVLLENIDEITNPQAVEKVFSDFKEEYGAPLTGEMKNKK